MKNRISALIVDDESSSRRVLHTLLKTEFDFIDICGEAAGVEEAYRLVLQHEPDIVFLDIQMPGAGGFNLLAKFEKVPFGIIFVTSYDKYAINAIKFSALDYLLKPVEIPALKDAIEKARYAVEQKINKNTQVINLLHSLETDSTDKKIAVHAGDKVKMISEYNIVYLESDRRYCLMHINTGEHFVLAKYLQDFESYFGERSSFIRISRSFMINARHIKEYSKGEPFFIEMVTGKIFEVARRKKAEVLEKLKNFPLL